jgi:hypothetical protein
MAKKTTKLPVANITADYPSTACKPYKPSKEEQERQRRYAAEDGLRAIQRAEEVKSNKQLMSDVKALASEQVNNLKKFCK